MAAALLWLVAPFMPLADLLALALAGRDGKEIASGELARRTVDVVRLGARLLFADILRKKNSVDSQEFPLFFSATGRQRRLMNWYVVLDILLPRPTSDDPELAELAAALSSARSNGDYRPLKACIGKGEDGTRRFVESAVRDFLLPRAPRAPWWLSPGQQKLVFGLLCKPFCCFCANEIPRPQGAHLILISEAPNVHLACTACHLLYCAHVPRLE